MVTAHGKTNLLHRGRLPSPEVPQGWVFAHGELQELMGILKLRREKGDYLNKETRIMQLVPNATI
jgi:hypothetical protein